MVTERVVPPGERWVSGVLVGGVTAARTMPRMTTTVRALRVHELG